MNASTASALLAQRAEAVCRQYLPNGKKQGRYWCAGDARGAKGRSLFVRLSPPGTPGKWTDAATGEHGDLLDLIRLATGCASLRETLAEARRFLAQPASPAFEARPDAYDHVRAARNLWGRCGPIDGTRAEAYLKARAIRRCRFPALRFHPALPYRPDEGGWRRFPALVAAVTADGGDLCGVHRTWLDPAPPGQGPRIASAQGAGTRPRAGRAVRRSGLGLHAAGGGRHRIGALLVTVLQGAAPPHAVAAAALSAGSLGAFVPPGNVTRLIVAQDRDEEGEIASLRLQLRCKRLGVACAVLAPAGGDFNDDLLELGPGALAERLAPLVRAARDRTGA